MIGWRWYMEFFTLGFWQDFTSNFVATLFGVLIGIPVALLIDRLASKKQDEREAEIQREIFLQKQKQLLLMVKETLQSNLEIIDWAADELEPETILVYNVDTQLLESTSSIKYEIIENTELNRRLDSIRYELLYLHHKLELQFGIAFISYAAMSNYMERRKELIRVIKDRLPTIRAKIMTALSEISALLSEKI